MYFPKRQTIPLLLTTQKVISDWQQLLSIFFYCIFFLHSWHGTTAAVASNVQSMQWLGSMPFFQTCAVIPGKPDTTDVSTMLLTYRMAVLVAGDTNSKSSRQKYKACFWKRFGLVLHIHSKVHLLYAQCSIMSYCIYLAFQLWLAFICILPWPTFLPCFLCCCDSYFPSWESIKSYLFLSYLIYLCTAGNTRQTLMELKKQGDLSAFFSSILFKGFWKAFIKTRTNDSISSV